VLKVREIEGLVFHCSDSNWGDVDVIRDWHVNGNGWQNIGYNLVITNGKPLSTSHYEGEEDGRAQEGRSLDFSEYIESDEKAAHTLNYNHRYIGVCLIGKDKFTIKQFRTAANTAKMFLAIVGDHLVIKGHYEMPTARGKTCPNFGMAEFRDLVESNDLTDSNIEYLMGDWILAV
jgi:hypothetical protein